MKLFTKVVVPSIRILRNYSLLKPHNVGIIGVPFDKGQPRSGTAEGPKAIRNGGLIEQLQLISAKINVKDYGDIAYEEEPNSGRNVQNMKLLSHVAACNKNLSDKVEEILKDDRICLTLGGDHSIAIGSIDGHLRYNRNISVIWVDAHADFNTDATSPSGNMHGMPVALLAKEMEDYWPYIPGMDWQKPQ